ncbi:hypothetical protein PL373_08040 [Tenacibaculum maritimum]|nr:hypothetical protein [Tenacibaculum maritimum]MDB0601096.1 hypothetical protein [Tenacibaculum maritimum]MDB0612178.1 hypothetical protein [Tenacibaculum maritimum]
MKTQVVTFSKSFPYYHSKAGEPTNFIEKILKQEKITTIRTNLDRWYNIQEKLNKGEYILSLRYWSDIPYRSKQIEFAKCSSIDIKEVFITNGFSNGFQISINDSYCYHSEIEKLTKSEGFENRNDLEGWFNKEVFSGAIIEFKEVSQNKIH